MKRPSWLLTADLFSGLQACIALVRWVGLQTQFSRCETLVRSHENSER